MRRAYLGVGDKAGEAVVTEGLPSVTCASPPPRVHLATLYMKTWCNACKQEGYIAPRGPRHPGTAPNGQQWALGGDINICGCSPPPVFYAERNKAMIFTAEKWAAQMEASTATSAETVPADAFTQYFQLKDEQTGKPISGIPYRIVMSNGAEFEGRTDAQGHTQRVSSDWDISAMLHVLEDETPINPYWDR